jgi:hypothetical protein
MRSDRVSWQWALAALLAVLAACATERPGRRPPSEPPASCIPGTVLLIYQSNLLGEILPCG